MNFNQLIICFIAFLLSGGCKYSVDGLLVEDINKTSLDNVGHDNRNKYRPSISLHDVKLVEMSELEFKNSKKLNLHLIVGEPVIKIKNSKFVRSEVITSNITYQNQE